MNDSYAISRIGCEGQPLVMLDDFAPDPDALRAEAIAAQFEPAAHYYPGIRAPIPVNYMEGRMALIADAIGAAFGLDGDVRLIDASFSIVTRPPGMLSVQQRLPHCDAFSPNRIAFIQYLSLAGGDGTGFYRHRSTGFETIDEARRPIFFGQLDAELRLGGLPPSIYVAGDTPLFEQIGLAEARYNRALLYPSYLLHSGAIAPDATLSADAALGRLTITAFLAVE